MCKGPEEGVCWQAEGTERMEVWPKIIEVWRGMECWKGSSERLTGTKSGDLMGCGRRPGGFQVMG